MVFFFGVFVSDVMICEYHRAVSILVRAGEEERATQQNQATVSAYRTCGGFDTFWPHYQFVQDSALSPAYISTVEEAKTAAPCVQTLQTCYIFIRIYLHSNPARNVFNSTFMSNDARARVCVSTPRSCK